MTPFRCEMSYYTRSEGNSHFTRRDYKIPYRSVSFALSKPPGTATFKRNPYHTAIRRRSQARMRSYRTHSHYQGPLKNYDHVRGICDRYRTNSVNTARYRQYGEDCKPCRGGCLETHEPKNPNDDQYSNEDIEGKDSNISVTDYVDTKRSKSLSRGSKYSTMHNVSPAVIHEDKDTQTAASEIDKFLASTESKARTTENKVRKPEARKSKDLGTNEKHREEKSEDTRTKQNKKNLFVRFMNFGTQWSKSSENTESSFDSARKAEKYESSERKKSKKQSDSKASRQHKSKERKVPALNSTEESSQDVSQAEEQFNEEINKYLSKEQKRLKQDKHGTQQGKHGSHQDKNGTHESHQDKHGSTESHQDKHGSNESHQHRTHQRGDEMRTRKIYKDEDSVTEDSQNMTEGAKVVYSKARSAHTKRSRRRSQNNNLEPSQARARAEYIRNDKSDYSRDNDKTQYNRNKDKAEFNRSTDKVDYRRNSDKSQYKRNTDKLDYSRNTDKSAYNRNTPRKTKHEMYSQESPSISPSSSVPDLKARNTKDRHYSYCTPADSDITIRISPPREYKGEGGNDYEWNSKLGMDRYRSSMSRCSRKTLQSTNESKYNVMDMGDPFVRSRRRSAHRNPSCDLRSETLGRPDEIRKQMENLKHRIGNLRRSCHSYKRKKQCEETRPEGDSKCGGKTPDKADNGEWDNLEERYKRISSRGKAEVPQTQAPPRLTTQCPRYEPRLSSLPRYCGNKLKPEPRTWIKIPPRRSSLHQHKKQGGEVVCGPILRIRI